MDDLPADCGVFELAALGRDMVPRDNSPPEPVALEYVVVEADEEPRVGRDRPVGQLGLASWSSIRRLSWRFVPITYKPRASPPRTRALRRVSAELDVGPASSHVGRDGAGRGNSGLGDDRRLLCVVSRIEHSAADGRSPREPSRQMLRFRDAGGADENRPPLAAQPRGRSPQPRPPDFASLCVKTASSASSRRQSRLGGITVTPRS